jgi:hypothetical protein
MVTLEELGLTRDEILDRVVAKIADSLIDSYVMDEDGEETATQSPFARAMQRKVQERVDKAVEEIAARHVLPNVAAYVETLCLQETNKWGEKTGRRFTFVEYLVDRAEKYLTEEVNYEGKTKGEDSYSWRKSGTRIAYMVHKHLQYSIQSAMEHALKNANAAIVGGIEEAVKIKLGEVAAALKVKTEIGR